jgi:hemerythrin-like metal-binding protein
MIFAEKKSNRLKDIKSNVSGMLYNNDFEKIQTNILVLDKQHKILIDTVKEILNILKSPKINKTKVGSCLGNLVVYAGEHFSHEETLMKAWKYPDFINHRKKHDKFSKQLNVFIVEIEDQKDLLDFALRLEEWLLVWIFDELLNDDLRMVNSLRKRRRTMWFYLITTVIFVGMFIIFHFPVPLIFIVIFLLLLPEILIRLRIV